MKRGEVHLTGGCVEGASGMKGRCWLCGTEWEEENCCNTRAHCPCMALAEDWKCVTYKNIVLALCHWFAMPFNAAYEYFWVRWYS